MIKKTDFLMLAVISLLLLMPVGAAQANGQSENIYNRLAAEFEQEIAKFEKGEKINATELMFKGYAIDAVDFTKKTYGKQLDFSEASIKDVEECLDALNKAREQYKPSDEQLLTTAKLYAGYIGQVIKLKWGGEWRDESEYSINNGSALKIKDTNLFILSKVHRRLTGGAEDNVWHYYLVEKNNLESK